MKKFFYKMADFAISNIKDGETLLVSYYGEKSEFCRFNHSKIRQAGTVNDCGMSLKLITGTIHAACHITLSQNAEIDQVTIAEKLTALRKTLSVLPEDPHFLYSKEVKNSEVIDKNELIGGKEMAADIVGLGEGLDLVGILATGGIYRGFANSLGQKNWFEKYTFNFDWSAYLHSDKAVKSAYAGTKWDKKQLAQNIEEVRGHLEVLDREPKTIDPGKYNVYLSPAAISEIIGMMSWGGFSEKAVRTKQSPLLKMIEENSCFSKSVTISENKAGGLEPNFDSSGFTVPQKVDLICEGAYKGSLISPRTAKEYGLSPNSGSESPGSIDVSSGDIERKDILKRLGTGIYINNLWYLNYSDRQNCKLTGMTRFASFWVEDGKIVAPLNVMRFDESLYNLFGDNLVGMTKEREFMLNPQTYGRRSVASENLPGAIVNDMNFTL